MQASRNTQHRASSRLAAKLWQRGLSAAVAGIVSTACGGIDAQLDPAGSQEAETEASPEEVLEAHAYLQQFGYFDSEELRESYPNWDPIVGGEAQPHILGEEMRSALSELQRRYHLSVTGDLDTATLALIRSPRCGVPDSFTDGQNKWAPWGDRGYSSDRTLTYYMQYALGHFPPSHLISNLNLPQETIEAAAAEAFDEWSDNSRLEFTFEPGGFGDIQLYFDELPSNVLGRTTSSGHVTINSAIAWTAESLEEVILHEVGHWLGFGHSSDPIKPVMWPTSSHSNYLVSDDLQALSVSPYTKWTKLSGAAARDIGVGSSSTLSAWAIGTLATGGGYTIHKYDEASGTWPQALGGAVRIDVRREVPFVVASDGKVFERVGVTSAVPLGTAWEHRSGLLASDIGAGNGAVWAISKTSVAGGYTIHRWRGGNNWSQIDGGAVRIDVGENNEPWVVNKDGAIFRRMGVTAGVPDGTHWASYTGVKAKDIGVSRYGAVWVTGGDLGADGYTLSTLNIQEAIDANGDGDTNDPNDADARSLWIHNGTAENVSVGPNELPWITKHASGANEVYRRTN